MRTYTASITTSAFTAARTLVFVEAPATMALIVIGAGVTAAANDTNQQLELSLDSIATPGSPTGTSITPGQYSVGDPASSVTALGNITASEPTYSGNPSDLQGASSLGGYRFEPGLGGPQVPPSKAIGLQLEANMGTSSTLTAWIKFVEIG